MSPLQQSTLHRPACSSMRWPWPPRISGQQNKREQHDTCSGPEVPVVRRQTHDSAGQEQPWAPTAGFPRARGNPGLQQQGERSGSYEEWDHPAEHARGGCQQQHRSGRAASGGDRSPAAQPRSLPLQFRPGGGRRPRPARHKRDSVRDVSLQRWDACMLFHASTVWAARSA